MPQSLSLLVNHLWQTTVFAGAAALAALALRKNRAGARYWIWLAASLKFLLPFALLVGLGVRAPQAVRPATMRLVPQRVVLAIEDAGQPFPTAPEAPARSSAGLLVAVWGCGVLAIGARWTVRWRRARRDVASRVEPAVFGVFRPVLVLPPGIADRLAPEQLRAIVAHERCHIRRRDNLFAVIHMAVEALFWFHPLVWWIGARLIEERERACDEEVLRLGNDPQCYAEGILNVCRFYLESRLECAAGVTGANLKRRIEAIMTNRVSPRLSAGRKLMLGLAGALAVAGPILIGAAHTPGVRAQTNPLTFEVASVKPAPPGAMGVRMTVTPGGGVRIENGTLKAMLLLAYDLQPFQISGGPSWIDSEQWEVIGKAPAEDSATGEPTPKSVGESRARMRALLQERFHLAARRETREGPVYALVVVKGGPKLKESLEGSGINRSRPGEMIASKAGIGILTRVLSTILRRPVLDETGLKSTYAFTLTWAPDPEMGGLGKPNPITLEKAEAAGVAPPDENGPSIFGALQEQLGLKLESRKGAVDTLVIDHAERPAAQ